MRVPWLSKAHIRRSALSVVSTYELQKGAPVRPPIPVEMIVEQSLGLQLCFDDLRGKLGIDDVLGATYVNLKRITIDKSLIDNETRLSFTCSHEIGHWVMHRDLIQMAKRVENSREAIFCRTKDAVHPIEWQSDYFASCLLMPEASVKAAWNSTFGPDPLILYNGKKSMNNGPLYFEPCAENWHLIASSVCRAGNFANCSKQAMIIRLQELGLLHNQSCSQMGWAQSLS